jgi:hypothetical protein
LTLLSIKSLRHSGDRIGEEPHIRIKYYQRGESLIDALRSPLIVGRAKTDIAVIVDDLNASPAAIFTQYLYRAIR